MAPWSLPIGSPLPVHLMAGRGSDIAGQRSFSVRETGSGWIGTALIASADGDPIADPLRLAQPT